MNLANINTIKSILKTEGFSFKKSLGQNFLIDGSVCPAMANAACDGETGVIEIGPGIGVLTAELSKVAKRVVAIELDDRLQKVLPKTLADCKNVEVIFGDAMKLDLKKIIESGNVIEIYDDIMNYTFTFYYVYSGDSQEAVFLNNKFYCNANRVGYPTRL